MSETRAVTHPEARATATSSGERVETFSFSSRIRLLCWLADQASRINGRQFLFCLK